MIQKKSLKIIVFALLIVLLAVGVALAGNYIGVKKKPTDGNVPVSIPKFVLNSVDSTVQTETPPEMKNEINDFVKVFYYEGIPYTQANALGPEAIPYLLDILKDPNEKKFWVNVIVTIGFIEDEAVFDPLVDMLQNTEGEVDVQMYKALTSIPFAIGCIASKGSPKVLNYLKENSLSLSWDVKWTFKEKDVAQTISEKMVRGLGMSGRPEAKKFLLKLQKQVGAREAKITAKNGDVSNKISDSLWTIDKIEKNGRSSVFNR